MRIRFLLLLLMLMVSVGMWSQDAPKPTEPPKTLSTDARLQAAKTVYIKNTSKSDIPIEVVRAAFEGWPKYMVVDDPEKADLIVQVDAPTELPANSDDKKDKEEKQKDMTITSIRLVALEAHTKVTLWAQGDRPTGKGSKEEKAIAATQRLIHAFKKKVEPDSVD